MKNTSIEKLQHQKINLETVSMQNLGQLLTGLEVRSNILLSMFVRLRDVPAINLLWFIIVNLLSFIIVNYSVFAEIYAMLYYGK